MNKQIVDNIGLPLNPIKRPSKLKTTELRRGKNKINP